MGYLLWFGIVGLLFAWMHYFTELDGKKKGIISFVVTLVISGAVAYNIAADHDREKVASVELRYRSGETLKCSSIDVNTSTFDYSVGTQSFVGLKGTPRYQQIINARECE